MAIMTCPKCGGGGKATGGNDKTSTGFYELSCSSCGGTGYVSDTPVAPPNVIVNADNLKLETAMEDHYLKCPKCHELIRVNLGHYLVLPDFGKRL